MPRPISCLRCLLLGCVVLLGFLGTVVITGSGVFLYQLQEYGLLTPSRVNGPALTLMALGLLTCILSWCAWQFDYSNKAQIVTFAVFLSILAGSVTAVGIWSYVRSDNIDTLPDTVVQKALYTLYDPNSESIWNHMQIRLDCCGVHGRHEDFVQLKKPVPPACCYDPVKGCSKQGCLNPVINRTRAILLYIFLLALTLALMQALIVAISVCYAKAIAEGIEKRRDEILRAAQASATSRASSVSAPSRVGTTSELGSNFSPLVLPPLGPNVKIRM